MYAIRNTKTGKWMYGTDKRHYPWRQNTSSEQMMTFDSYEAAKLAFLLRKCGKSYEIVPIKVDVIKEEE